MASLSSPEINEEKRGTITFLKSEDRLKYDPTSGDNNLDDFTKKLEIALKVNFGIYSKIVRTGAIPVEWTQEPEDLDSAAESALSTRERKARDAQERLVDGWKMAQLKMVPHILANISVSSQQRIDERHRDPFTTACLDNDIEQVWKIITDTHLYRNVDATASEISEKQTQFLLFSWVTGESISNHMHRWSTMIRSRDRLGIKVDTSYALMHYCKSLNSHPSEHVRKICTDKIAEINLLSAAEKDDARHSVADVYSRILALLAASSTKPIDSVKGSAPMALKPMPSIRLWKRWASTPPTHTQNSSSRRSWLKIRS